VVILADFQHQLRISVYVMVSFCFVTWSSQCCIVTNPIISKHISDMILIWEGTAGRLLPSMISFVVAFAFVLGDRFLEYTLPHILMHLYVELLFRYDNTR